MCEVDPEVDTSRRTEVLAANALVAIIAKRVFNATVPIPLEKLREVFYI